MKSGQRKIIGLGIDNRDKVFQNVKLTAQLCVHIAIHRDPKDRLEFRIREPLYEVSQIRDIIAVDIVT